MNNYIGMFIIVLASTIILGCADQQPEEYESLNIKGSDTLVQLVADMAEMYMDQRPEVDIVVTGGGSGTGIAALMNGEIDIADASRPMKSKEIEGSLVSRVAVNFGRI